MKIIEATYQIVTPMFIGDTDGNATSLRPPSIKCALRFWWRALNWKNVDSLKELHEKESRLFGSAATDDGGGQGTFLLQVNQQPKITPNDSWPTRHDIGSSYLGFGLTEMGQQHRTAITEINNKFTISLAFKPKNTNLNDDIESLKETLEIFGLFGGLDSRVRNGFGSVSLVFLKLNDTENKYDYLNLNEYKNKIHNLLSNYQTIDFPPYTAFSQHACFEIIQSSETDDAKNSHEKAGNRYKKERSKIDLDDRIPLGLPLKGIGNQKDRRSSPLIFHVHPLKDGKFVTGVLYLPAEFHPDYPQHNLTNFYQPATQLLNKI